MKTYHLIGSAFWLLCGGAIMAGAMHLPLGTLGNPGPGFLPLAMGSLLAILAGAGFIQAVLQAPGARHAFFPDASRWPKILTTVVAMVLYSAFMPHVGFVLLTPLLMLCLFKMVGGMRWRGSLAGAFLTSFASYFLFDVFLNVQFPIGFWSK